MTDFSKQAEQYMRRALDLARKAEGRTRPNPAVGAVIVKNGEIIGEGYHRRAGEPHAEIHAIREAGDRVAGSELYVTLEPCSHHGRTGPCTEAILAAGIEKVFVGTGDPNPQVCGRGIARLQNAGVSVCVGVLEEECRRLIAPFAKHILTGSPLVTLKSAVTLDGKIATSTGDSQWISGESSRLYVHTLRNKVDGIIVGIGTVLADNPRLTTRLPEGGRNALRIIVDSHLRIPEDAAVLECHANSQALVATTPQADPGKMERLKNKGVEVLVVPVVLGRVNLRVLMSLLGERGLQNLILEGGATINRSFLQEGLVDRAMFFVAPLLLGGDDGPGPFSGAGVARLSEAWRLKDVRITQFDDDVLFEGEVHRCSPG